MTTEFIIKTPSGPILKFEKHSDHMNDEGWGDFVVTLHNAPVNGSITLSDLEPNRWADFFEDLSMNWRGWKGIKKVESIEGDLILQASSDSLGHISIRTELRADQGGSDWLVAGTLVLEAGALDTIAKSAKKFFNYKSIR
jgi:hypothetical protein